LALLPLAPWQAAQTAALLAPASTLPAGRADVLTMAPQIVAARIQIRFMILKVPL
jgi:hypothetical protein